jgi:hypothetical protein
MTKTETARSIRPRLSHVLRDELAEALEVLGAEPSFNVAVPALELDAHLARVRETCEQLWSRGKPVVFPVGAGDASAHGKAKIGPAVLWAGGLGRHRNRIGDRDGLAVNPQRQALGANIAGSAGLRREQVRGA